jgi:hypothetical protein
MNSQDEILNKHADIIDSYLSYEPTDLICLKAQFISMLEYLCSPTGRTNHNCVSLNDHAMLNDDWLAAKLPDDFKDLIIYMAGALHDTFGAPDIAKSELGTPEQLLERAKKLKAEPAHRPYLDNAR